MQGGRGIGISEQSYYRWRRNYGGLKLDQVERLKDLERESDHRKKAVAELTLNNLILKEALDVILSHSPKRACVEHVRSRLQTSEGRACAIGGQPGAAQRPFVRLVLAMSPLSRSPTAVQQKK